MLPPNCMGSPSIFVFPYLPSRCAVRRSPRWLHPGYRFPRFSFNPSPQSSLTGNCFFCSPYFLLKSSTPLIPSRPYPKEYPSSFPPPVFERHSGSPSPRSAHLLPFSRGKGTLLFLSFSVSLFLHCQRIPFTEFLFPAWDRRCFVEVNSCLTL